MDNILVRVPGKVSSSLLLSAHFDSRHLSLGATDAGSGVVACMEILRQVILSVSEPTTSPHHVSLENTLIINLNGGEENGLFGSRSFRQHPLWNDVVGVLINGIGRILCVLLHRVFW